MRVGEAGALVALVLSAMVLAAGLSSPVLADTSAAAEYQKHFAALTQLSIAVAEAMPEDQYGFRPHPESMTFGQVMVHIATTNYQFCAGLSDEEAPKLSSPKQKAEILRLLDGSFSFCAGVINALSEQQLNAPHDSPDGRMPGREVLLAMYVHVAHHRGQAEIYLRDKGIRPPRYRV